MSEGQNDWLAAKFEEHRSHLRAVAYRMLGSSGEADDAVQEAWIRLSRSGGSGIENLGGWLTTTVAHVCLDALRSRQSRREDSLDEQAPPPLPALTKKGALDPEQEAILADSVGIALLVVLDRLEPAERLAFVLHDMFSVPFDEIAAMLGRSEPAVRQLASRARRRVRGVSPAASGNLAEQRKSVETFLAALHAGDFDTIVSVLDPELAVHLDPGAGQPGAPAREIHGAEAWARGALAFSQYTRFMQPAIIDGAVGVVFAPGGRLARALKLTFANGRIATIHVIVDPKILRQLELAPLGTEDLPLNDN
jgi:RNA polymerase sigma factor (sigma-70 family)